MEHVVRTLGNGTRVVLVSHKDSASVSVCAFYAVGSRYETPKLWGASHFIEHMMFKGTEKRPTAQHISRDLDGVGADYNAYTGKDTTLYYIRLRADKVSLAVDLLQDMIYNSKIDAKEVASERGVIAEEIRMYEDNPVMVVDEMLEEELFAQSTLGKKIAGTTDSLAKIGREELLAYQKAYYIPSRTVLAVAGKFDEETIMAQLEATFGKIVEPKKKPQPFKPFVAVQAAVAAKPASAKAAVKKPTRPARCNVTQRETEQIQLALGFPSYGLGHPQLPTLSILANILGGTMSSRLFVEVREKRGLAYSVRASSGPYQDVGSFVIQAGLTKGRVDEALKIIAKELQKLIDKPVGKEELTRAKENMKGRIALSLEDSSTTADWFGRKLLLTGKITTPEEYIAKLEKVTADDIKRAAKDIFKKKTVCVAAIGPIEKPETLLAPFAILG